MMDGSDVNAACRGRLQQQGRLEQEEQRYKVDHDARRMAVIGGFHRFGPGEVPSEKRAETDWRGYSRGMALVER